MAPALPGFRSRRNLIVVYKFSELFDKTEDELEYNGHKTVYIDNIDELINNFDFFKKLLSHGYYGAYSKDYKVLEYIEKNTDRQLELHLIDDFENKDRSYIDVDSFEKSKIRIPIAYALWVDSKNDLLINQYLSSDNLFPSSQSGTEKIELDDLKRIREEVYKLNEKCKNLDDIERIIIVSDYLQNRVQFIDHNNVSVSSSGTYITKGRIVTNDDVGNIANVIFNRFGVCRGIASANTVLLNNPQMNVNIRNVSGDGHVWNVAKIGNKYYYIDNTWNITRNISRYPGSLKAKDFSSEYLLFGERKASEIGHHIADSVIPSVEEDDYNRKMLDNKVKRLQYTAKYNNYDKPAYESYKKEDI